MSDSLEQIAARLADQISRMSQTSKNWPHDWLVLKGIIDQQLRAAQATGRAETEARIKGLQEVIEGNGQARVTLMDMPEKAERRITALEAELQTELIDAQDRREDFGCALDVANARAEAAEAKLATVEHGRAKGRCECGHPEIQHETYEYRGDKARHCLTEDCLCRRFKPTGSAEGRAAWQPIETYVASLGEQVWTWDNERGSNPSMLCNGYWLITYDSTEIHPTHWMPLPSPPAPEREP